MFKIVR